MYCFVLFVRGKSPKSPHVFKVESNNFYQDCHNQIDERIWALDSDSFITVNGLLYGRHLSSTKGNSRPTSATHIFLLSGNNARQSSHLALTNKLLLPNS